jgi:putative membrane protein
VTSEAPIEAWLPYCGAAPLPSQWIERWNLDPVLLAGLVAAGLALHFAKPERTGPKGRLALALALFALLFVSPLCTMGSALFTVRTLHHIVLLTALAPLLAQVPAILRIARRFSLGALTAAQLAILWAWHAPVAYEAALSSDTVFWAMQASLLGSAAPWWAKLRQAHAGAAVISLLATMVLTGMLGALLTFAGRALYAPHWLTTQAWGMSPLADQQLAGIIMWAPASAIYLIVACAVLYRALNSPVSVPSSMAAR